jgi:hypothetical protein
MSPGRPLWWGAAIRLLRWLPVIAGLIALDRVGGVKGLLIGAVVAIDVTALSILIHNRLTRLAGRAAPDASWREGILVWAGIAVFLALQVALGDPGGTAGRVLAVLAGLILGSVVSELLDARQATAGPPGLVR